MLKDVPCSWEKEEDKKKSLSYLIANGVGPGAEVLIRKYMGVVHYPFEME